MRATDIIASINACYHARAPLAIWGPPGVGKTAITQQAHDLLGVELGDAADLTRIYLRANLIDAVDVTGIPVPDGDRVRWLPPDFIPREGTRGMLVIDELPQAPQSVQCALMRLVDHLPVGWSVVALGNRATDRAGAGQVATHVLDRFTHVELDVSRDDWQTWSLRAGIDQSIRALIDFRPALLMQFDPAARQAERAGCSPRSWERASRILQNCPETVRHGLLCGTVGQGPATELEAFIRLRQDLPDPDAIIAAPGTTTVPTEPSVLYAVCAALAERAKTLGQTKLDGLVRYLGRLPVEFGARLMIDVLALQPAALMVPSAGDWINRHREVFTRARK